MSYATTANRANPLAALGALAIPGAIGALFIAGFAIKHIVVVAPPNPDTTFVPIDPIETPPDPKPTTDPVSSNQTASVQDPKVITPTLPPPGPETINVNTTGPITLPSGGTGGGIDGVGTISLPPLTPSFDPVRAAPSGNPGTWITNDDYRGSWITRGYDGIAGFELAIDARGRVTNCSITRSTGHRALDDATCRLLERRARFEPARDSSGAAVAGTYSSSVNWSIPE